jgi:hypothetical protein
MKFYKQLCKHNPPESIGDCFRTALGCLIDRPPESVPHFVKMFYNTPDPDNKLFKEAVRDWLRPLGYSMIQMCFALAQDDKIQDVLEHIARVNGDDVLYLLTGKSILGPHVVVCRGPKIFWDPSPENTGIVAPIDGHLWAEFLISNKMRYDGCAPQS